MPSAVRLGSPFFTLACLVLAAGCAQIDLNESFPWFSRTEDEPSIPAKAVAVWTETVLHRPDGLPERGFGGRLMFYGDQTDKSVPVDGTLIVYAFDEEGRRPTDARPDRKYVFPAEHFAQHHSKSDLGHSYSVWLPWDELGGPQKEIGLIVRFLPTEGPPIVVPQTRHLLSGTAKPAPGEYADARRGRGSQALAQNPVRPVSHETAIPTVQEKRQADGSIGQMQTHTITVPPNFGRGAPMAVVRPRATSRETALRRPAQAPPAEQTARAGAPSQQASPGPSPRSTRSSRPRYQAPAGPAARPTPGRAPWQSRLAGWPSYSQSTPPQATASEAD